MEGSLTSQQKAELEFWRGLIERVGPEYFYSYRVAEYYDKTKHFPSFLQQKGIGIDYGCGCISVFEASSKRVIAYDPLWDRYMAMLPPQVQVWRVTTPTKLQVEAEISWVACINVIDHSPDPEALLADIHRKMASEGTLYFEVNFEAGLAAPHYSVWDETTVKQFLTEDDGWKLMYKKIEDVPQHKQRRYWAEYRRI